MPEEGSVWDSGPQYPDLWPDPSGDPAPGPDTPDQTPPAPSPVDLDALAVIEGQPPESQPAAPAPTAAWWRGPFLGLATWIWLVCITVLVVALAIAATSGGGRDPELVAVESQPSVASVAPGLATTLEVPTTVTAGTFPAVTLVPETSAPLTTAPLTTSPATAAPAPTTVAATTPPPTTGAAGPVVTIIGRVGPCNFGNECLIAGFSIEGFDAHPTEFVCEFADGSRHTFGFDSDVVDHACATGDPTDSITIEVAGVRSETFRHP